MRLVMLGVLLALAPVPAVFAQAAPDGFDICALEQGAAARLACFDRQIAARRPSGDVGLDARQLRKLHPQRAESDKAAPALIEGKVLRVVARRPLISVFELDNGQVWEQTETLAGLWVQPQETVTIREGKMGGFLLSSADGHRVRVRRVR